MRTWLEYKYTDINEWTVHKYKYAFHFEHSSEIHTHSLLIYIHVDCWNVDGNNWLASVGYVCILFVSINVFLVIGENIFIWRAHTTTSRRVLPHATFSSRQDPESAIEEKRAIMRSLVAFVWVYISYMFLLLESPFFLLFTCVYA